MEVNIQFNPKSELGDARAIFDRLETPPIGGDSKPVAKRPSEPSLDERRKEVAKRTAVIVDAVGDAEVKEAHKASGLPRVGKMNAAELGQWEKVLVRLESVE